jgi:hypothetical protein
MNIAKRVMKAEKIAEYVRENLLVKCNAFDNGEINWNFVEADLCLIAKGLNDERGVRDPLPTPDFEIGNYEEIEAAFDLIHRTHIS